MGKREDFLKIIDSRNCDVLPFSPGIDMVFAASLAGKRWVSDATLEDQFLASKIFGHFPILVDDALPCLQFNPALDITVYCIDENEDARKFEQTVHGPNQSISRTIVETFGGVMTIETNWAIGQEQLPLVDWISRDLLEGDRDHAIGQKYKSMADKCAPYGPTAVKIELPYFIYGLAGYGDGPLTLLRENPRLFQSTMNMAEKATMHMIDILLASGIDIIAFSSPGTNFLSLEIWNEIIIPQAAKLAEHIRQKSGRSMFKCSDHCWSLVEHGCFNQIQMDILEGLAPPPMGNIVNLKHARTAIDKQIVTRGNIDPSLLHSGDSDHCVAATKKIIDAVAGYPHILGTSNFIMHGSQIRNIASVQNECRSAAERKIQTFQRRQDSMRDTTGS